MARLREARRALDQAQAAFEREVTNTYERRQRFSAEQVAQAAGWRRARLYQFLKGQAKAAA